MSHVAQQKQPAQRRPVAVFDYDGTCINGESGKLISLWLLRKGYLGIRAAVGLSWWGIRYRLHMPLRQERSRELIYGELASRGADAVRSIMKTIHEEALLPLYRKAAIGEIARQRAEGCATVLVSATFEDVACHAARHLGTDGYVATKMELDNAGEYTGRVLGEVVVGEAKVRAVTRWADEHLGEGSWFLAYAYGDHYTDKTLLSGADHPVVVSPGPTLKRYAREHGWPIANWRVR